MLSPPSQTKKGEEGAAITEIQTHLLMPSLVPSPLNHTISSSKVGKDANSDLLFNAQTICFMDDPG